jgi:L,D-transpeptidase YcbB
MDISLTIMNTKLNSIIGFLVTILIVIGCANGNHKEQTTLSASNIYSSQNFTDLVLDSTKVSSFLKAFPVTDSIKKEVTNFYSRRDFQFAWFNKKGMIDAVQIFYNQLQNYRINFSDNSLKNLSLDSLMKLTQANQQKFFSQANRVQQLELILTTTFFKYAQKVYGGETKNLSSLEWFIPRKKKNYQILLDSLVSYTKGEKLQEPLNRYYIRLKEKLSQYRGIQQNGGFPFINTLKIKLAAGDSDSCLLLVKKHLLLSGDLKADDNTIVFTNSLVKAVKNFQKRLGLVENGKIDSLMIAELNRPIDFRIRQVMINMERLRWMPEKMETDFLLINIPEFKLHVIKSGKEIWETNVVVGQAATQTSIFKANLSQITLNPYWVIPTDIAWNEIVPKIIHNSSYLVNYNMEVLSGNEVVDPSTINWSEYKTAIPFTIRQKPGKNNALGKIVFLFPNNFDIYLHDTPSKNLFEESQRDFSHGCIRVAEPKRLAIYLLRKTANWSIEKVDKILKTDTETNIAVLPSIPVYITYFTTWVDDEGQLNFRNDVYNLDSRLSKEIFGE